MCVLVCFFVDFREKKSEKQIFKKLHFIWVILKHTYLFSVVVLLTEQ